MTPVPGCDTTGTGTTATTTTSTGATEQALALPWSRPGHGHWPCPSALAAKCHAFTIKCTINFKISRTSLYFLHNLQLHQLRPFLPLPIPASRGSCFRCRFENIPRLEQWLLSPPRDRFVRVSRLCWRNVSFCT